MAEQYRVEKVMTLADLIRSHGYSVMEFAEQIGICTSSIYMMDKTKVIKRQTSTLYKIARKLCMSEEEVRQATGIVYANTHPLFTEIAKKGYSISDFSRKFGVPYETIRSIISGHVKKPQADTIGYIADCLEVDEARLI